MDKIFDFLGSKHGAHLNLFLSGANAAGCVIALTSGAIVTGLFNAAVAVFCYCIYYRNR